MYHLFFNRARQLVTNPTIIAGLLFSFFSFVNRGFSFLLLLILANFISPKEYGYLSLFSTITMLIGFFIAFSSEGYLSVAYFKDGKDGIKKTFSSVFLTSNVFMLLCTLVIYFGGDIISGYVEISKENLYVALFISYFTLYANLNLDLFRLEEKVYRYGWFSCSNALLNFVLSIVLVKNLLLGWEGRIYAQIICFFIFGVFGLYYCWKKGYIGFPCLEYWKKIMIWGLPLIPHLATSFIRQGCDRFIINSYHSISDVGLFSFALNLANIIMMLGLGLNQANSVNIYKILGDTSTDKSKKTYAIHRQQIKNIMFLAILSVLIIILCIFVIPLLAPQYEHAMKYFPLLSVYSFLFCLYLLYTNVLFFYGKTRLIMYITFGSSLIHLLLSYTFTRYSLFYTCWIYVLTQGLVVMGIMFFSKKLLKLK